MKKSRFSEEKIIAILKEAEAGVKTAEICRKHGIRAQHAANLCRCHPSIAGLFVMDIDL